MGFLHRNSVNHIKYRPTFLERFKFLFCSFCKITAEEGELSPDLAQLEYCFFKRGKYLAQRYSK